MTIELGRLQPVPPREVWRHEALDFTPWLLENVDVLSDLLGMDLVLETAEHAVGSFSLDLIGRDESTGERVIVENQLEMSDHTHLGQIITYAAGTDPTVIVWVTTGFRPEHRAAIDWLNERTDEKTRVFGVVIHTVQIGDSHVAPNFELVAQPNDWEQAVRTSTRVAGEPSGKALVYGEFWDQFLSTARASGADWVPRGVTTYSSYCDTRTDVPEVIVAMAFRKAGLRLELYFNSGDPTINQDRFEALAAHRTEFDQALAELEPVWDPMEGRKAARVVLSSPYSSVDDSTMWPQLNQWLLDAQARLRDALRVTQATVLLKQAGDA